MYVEKDNTGRAIIQDLDEYDVEVLINSLSESLASDLDMNPYSIERKKIIKKTLEELIMARETIKCAGGNLVKYSPFIEDLFTGPGIQVERINKDFIEIRLKRFFPKKLINEKIQQLEAKLKEDGRI